MVSLERRLEALEIMVVKKRFVFIDGDNVRIGGKQVDGYQQLPGDVVIRINRIDTMASIGLVSFNESFHPTETPNDNLVKTNQIETIDAPPELIEDHPQSGGRPIFPVASIRDVADFHKVGPAPQTEPVPPILAKHAPEPVGQLADETGRSPATIRTAIDREDKNQTSSLTKLSGTDKHRPHTPLEEKQPAPSRPSKWFRRI